MFTNYSIIGNVIGINDKIRHEVINEKTTRKKVMLWSWKRKKDYAQMNICTFNIKTIKFIHTRYISIQFKGILGRLIFLHIK